MLTLSEAIDIAAGPAYNHSPTTFHLAATTLREAGEWELATTAERKAQRTPAKASA